MPNPQNKIPNPQFPPHHLKKAQIFPPFSSIALPVDSFVKFREFEDNRKDEICIRTVNVEECSAEEALQHMPNRVVVVDDVNNKNLFHIVLGPGEASDVVHFNQTDIRPKIGDFLRINYCYKKNKEGKKKIKILDIHTSEVGCEGLKDSVVGRLEVKYHNDYFDHEDEPDFAFVKDFYVHLSILRKYNITDDCDVVAYIVLGGDNKWKVYDLEIH